MFSPAGQLDAKQLSDKRLKRQNDFFLTTLSGATNSSDCSFVPTPEGLPLERAETLQESL